MDSIKDVVRSSVWVPEFEKHLKKAGGHIGRNVVEITIKMKTIVRKPLMIKNLLSVLENETHKLLWEFEIQTDHTGRPYQVICQQKKRTFQIVELDILVDHSGQIKEREKRDTYLNFTNMKATVIPIVSGALGTISKELKRPYTQL